MIQLDAQKMDNRRNAHSYLREALSFPDYYGNNLDALFDCLTDLPETQVQFVNTENAPEYFQKVLRVFRDVAKRNPQLTITEEAQP